MQDRVVAYLDLLGFRSYATKDPTAAAEMLTNYQDVLAARQTNAKIQPISSIPSGPLKDLAERHSIDSFEVFIPMSDSIFIVSSAPDRLLAQLSTFLIDAFLLTGYVYATAPDPSSPTTHRVSRFQIRANGHPEIIETTENWYPVLFRGGISHGKVDLLTSTAIRQGQTCTVPNLVGPAVVQAVGLEGCESGPRLLCDKEMVSRLTDESRKYVRSSGDVYEVLWPGYIYAEYPENEIEKYRFNELFYHALTLWRAFKSSSVARHYQELIRLLVRAGFAFADKHDKGDEIAEYIESKLEEAQFQVVHSRTRDLEAQLIFPD